MHLPSISSVAIIATSFLVCYASADYDQAKMPMMGTTGLTRSVGPGPSDEHGGRLLRVHQEERGFDFSIGNLVKKIQAKNLAKAIMADPSRMDDAYAVWKAKGYTLRDINNFLKVADPKTKGKYDQISNGYAIHLDQKNSIQSKTLMFFSTR
ncbi:Inactive elicitor Avr1b [Phytophthora megakarya]|uniref:RxLR effector protein n=1 Tax=Phytophthora megakarya TaxID=4795 RepID=A0A225UD77_9STRA|nr:Inactive elicitor Avr1b [Phytophthora megakarya]